MEGRAVIIIEKVDVSSYHHPSCGEIYMRGNKVGGENCAELGKIYTCFVWPVQEMHAFNLTACTSHINYVFKYSRVITFIIVLLLRYKHISVHL